MEEALGHLMLETPDDELPAAVLGALEDKQQGELEDLLKRLYAQRARELKDQILALLEEKVQGQGVIGKNFRARNEAADALLGGVAKAAGGEVDPIVEKKHKATKERLAAEEKQELQELEKDYQVKKAGVERALQAKALAAENEQLEALRAKQLAEKERVVQERLADGRVKELLAELDKEEAEELAAFRAQQEEARQAKLAEMEREAKELEKQLDEELVALEALKDRAGGLRSRSGSPTAAGAAAQKGAGKARSNLQFQVKSKQEINALAKRGQQEYDALATVYMTERERQDAALEAGLAARAQRRRELDEAREREKREQEEHERQQYLAQMEQQRKAEEQCAKLRAEIQSRKKLLYKGGFS